MADIDVRPEGIRAAFAYNEAIQIDLVGVRQYLTPSSCISKLPGCERFKEVDQRTSDVLMQVLTRSDQLVKGLRQGAKQMADEYDKTDAEIKATLDSISPREADLPPVDDHLLLAERLNNAPQ